MKIGDKLKGKITGFSLMELLLNWKTERLA